MIKYGPPSSDFTQIINRIPTPECPRDRLGIGTRFKQ